MNLVRSWCGAMLLIAALYGPTPVDAAAEPPRRAAIPTYAIDLFTGFAADDPPPPQGLPLHGPLIYKGETVAHPILGCRFDDPAYRGHRGADFPASSGTPVYATLSGVVVWASERRGGWGQLVVIENNGWQTWFAHLSAIAVTVGDVVPAGAVVGAVGSTGHSTAPHLHYAVLQTIPLAGAPAQWRDPEAFWPAGAVIERPCW